MDFLPFVIYIFIAGFFSFLLIPIALQFARTEILSKAAERQAELLGYCIYFCSRDPH